MLLKLPGFGKILGKIGGVLKGSPRGQGAMEARCGGDGGGSGVGMAFDHE